MFTKCNLRMMLGILYTHTYIVGGKWQVASGSGWCRLVATRQLRLTFVLVFLPLCASHLAVRCVSCPGKKNCKICNKSGAKK